MGHLAIAAEKPSANEIQKVISKMHQGYGELLEWKKIDAESKTIDGQARYLIEFSSAVKLRDGWYYVPRELVSHEKGRRYGPGIFNVEISGPITLENLIQYPIKGFQKLGTGSIALFNGRVDLKRSENGWIATNSSIQNTKFCGSEVNYTDCKNK